MVAVESAKPARSVRGARGSREVGTYPATRTPGDRGDRCHGEEDAAPVGELEQPAADDRSERDRRARDRTPEADRERSLPPFGEHVGEQREGRGEHHRRPDAHHGAGRDQPVGAVHQPAHQARQPEDHETREQHPLAPEPVGQAAGSEDRCRKEQVERIHDPLELRIGCVQFAHQRRQRDVDDRGVEGDHERRQQQREQDQGLLAHCGPPASSGSPRFVHSREILA